MRLNGAKKMGFFPTPLNVVEQIKNLIKFPEGMATILDPCCGDGVALSELAQDNAITYGIELDQIRSKQAKEKLDRKSVV